jgi:membrane-bound lytic murein transglycosylase D
MEEPIPMTDLRCGRTLTTEGLLRISRRGAATAAWILAVLAAGCANAPLAGTPGPDPAAAASTAPAQPEVMVAPPAPEPDPDPILAPGSEPEGAVARAPSPPRGRLDPGQDAERIDLWERVRNGFAMPDLDNELVRKWEAWYAADPAYVQRMTERGGRYLFHILEDVQRRGMPTELALLPFIESAFNPQAMSRTRASGMWQFMPGTGKDFELRQNLFRDDRRDVLASTRAALDYLQQLDALFGDWHLALAAYNWGQGNVQRAIDRNRRAGLPTDYLGLAPRMPQETREYGPKLQAVKNIVLRPQSFGLSLPAFQNHPFFLSVPIERDIDVALAARLAGLSLEDFQQLNPQMNKPVILAGGTPRVLLPYDNANRFLHALSLHRGPLASWTAWVAPRTLKVPEAARLTGMPEDQLREVNHIPARMLVKVGSTLVVRRSSNTAADVPVAVADNAMIALAPEARPLRKVSFKAGRRGDSVAAVAQRYKVPAAQVALWNGVPAQARFKAGQAVVVMLPAPVRQLARSGAGHKRGAVSTTRLGMAQAMGPR